MAPVALLQKWDGNSCHFIEPMMQGSDSDLTNKTV